MDRFDRIAGRLVMAAPAGTVLTGREIDVLSEGRIGHLILFRRNLRDRSEGEDLIARARSFLPNPALVAVDQEGGILSVAAALAGTPPSPMRLGAAGDGEEVRRWARSQAILLGRAGVDMNLAPVLDVQTAGGSDVIGTRSFGGRPRLVSRLGAEAVRGAIEGGVVPVGKHFPGHGAVRADSHLRLPVDRRSRDEILRTALPPFRAAFAAGLPAVMIAHVAFPALGTGRRPATLSRGLIGGLLRRELGFRGVVMSDALEMAGFPGERFVPDAFAAGVDLFCAARSFAQGARVARRLATAFRRGEADAAAAEESARRIDRLHRGRKRSGPAAEPRDEPWKGIVRIGRGRFRPLGEERWRALLPERLGGRISLPVDLSRVVDRFGEPFRRRRITSFPFDPSAARRRRLLTRVEEDETVVVGLLGRGPLPEGQRRLFQALHARRGQRLIAVSLLDPSPLLSLPAEEKLFTFGFRAGTVEALFRVLTGEKRAEGKLPLSGY